VSDFKIRIGGEEYELPEMASITLSEAVLVNQITSLTLEEFFVDETETAWVGRAAVALMRGNPDWTVKKTVDTVNRMPLVSLEIIGPEVAEETVHPPNEPNVISSDGEKPELADPPPGAPASEAKQAA
jgi:hypothetical protein